MRTKAKVDADVLKDEAGRKFSVRKGIYTEILNCNNLGLFNDTKKLVDAGVRYFVIDLEGDIQKYVNFYKRILNGKRINDKKLRKGFTTGHMFRGVK